MIAPHRHGRWALVRIAVVALAIVACLLVLDGRPSRVVELTPLIVLIGISPLVAGASARSVSIAATLVLVTIALVAASVTVYSMTRWSTTWIETASLASIMQQAQGEVRGGSQFGVAAHRRWQTVTPTSGQSLRVDVTFNELPRAVSWQTSPRSMTVSADEGGIVGLGITGPSDFAFRSTSLSTPLADRHFVGSIELRSASPDGSCGRVYVGEHGARSASRVDVCVASVWLRSEVAWTAPSDSKTVLLDLILSEFSGPLEVGRTDLYEISGNERVHLGPLAPTGVTLRSVWSVPFPWNRSATAERFVTVMPSTSGPTAIELALPDGIPPGTTVWTSLHAEEGSRFQIDRTSWSTSGIVPVPSYHRLRLWFPHANIMAHAGAALGVCLLLTTRAIHLQAISILAAFALSLAAGSRTAAVAVLVSVLTYLITHMASQSLVRFKPWILTGVLLTVIGVVASGIASWTGTPLPRAVLLDSESLAERALIWSHAIDLIGASPLLGTTEPFETSWARAYPGGPSATHAHNGMLDAAVRFGLPAAIGLGLGLLGIIGAVDRPRRRHAAAALVTLLVLNTTDATYLSTWTTVPLFLAWLGVHHREDKIRPNHSQGTPLPEWA